MAHFQNDTAGTTFCVTVLAVIDTTWQERILVVRHQVWTVIRNTKISTFLGEQRNVLELFFASLSLSSELESNCKCGGIMDNFTLNDGLC